MNTIETMTVGELKTYLEEFPDSAKVVFSFPSHDHWRNELAKPIRYAEYGNVVYSEYHQTFKMLNSDGETDVEEGEEVLVLG